MLERLRTYLSFVRFSHSVFALPFALTGALLAARHAPVTLARRSAGFSSRWSRRAARRWDSTGWSTRACDALNPRTANARDSARRDDAARGDGVRRRRRRSLFVFAAWRLNPLCLALSPVALAIVFWYSLAKRFTT